MACDVGQYLPLGDSVVDELEEIVHSKLAALVGTRSSGAEGRRLAPKRNYDIQVTSNGRPGYKLKAYADRVGHLFAELHYGNRKIRSLHTHDGHKNPNKRDELPNGHMHFPTRRYPLAQGRSQHAYEEWCDDYGDLVAFLLHFCHLLGIEIDASQL